MRKTFEISIPNPNVILKTPTCIVVHSIFQEKFATAQIACILSFLICNEQKNFLIICFVSLFCCLIANPERRRRAVDVQAPNGYDLYIFHFFSGGLFS